MFTRAIVRKPCENLVEGITTSDLGKPDYNLALEQHNGYVKTLEKCGLEVVILDSDNRYPDSVFVEDTAIVTENCAIITNPGALSRKGEEIEIREVLKELFSNIETIKAPGTLEGGDVMRVENHFFIGLSKRTNEEGAKQLIQYSKKYGYTGSTIPVKNVLHLKTGVVYPGDNNILAAGEFIDCLDFKDFNVIKVDNDESYAVNCIRANQYVIVPEGFEKTKASVEKAGYKTLEVSMSEFRKLDGGLTCLSLRF